MPPEWNVPGHQDGNEQAGGQQLQVARAYVLQLVGQDEPPAIRFQTLHPCRQHDDAREAADNSRPEALGESHQHPVNDFTGAVAGFAPDAQLTCNQNDGQQHRCADPCSDDHTGEGGERGRISRCAEQAEEQCRVDDR